MRLLKAILLCGIFALVSVVRSEEEAWVSESPIADFPSKTQASASHHQGDASTDTLKAEPENDDPGFEADPEDSSSSTSDANDDYWTAGEDNYEDDSDYWGSDDYDCYYSDYNEDDYGRYASDSFSRDYASDYEADPVGAEESVVVMDDAENAQTGNEMGANVEMGDTGA